MSFAVQCRAVGWKHCRGAGQATPRYPTKTHWLFWIKINLRSSRHGRSSLTQAPLNAGSQSPHERCPPCSCGLRHTVQKDRTHKPRKSFTHLPHEPASLDSSLICTVILCLVNFTNIFLCIKTMTKYPTDCLWASVYDLSIVLWFSCGHVLFYLSC